MADISKNIFLFPLEQFINHPCSWQALRRRAFFRVHYETLKIKGETSVYEKNMGWLQRLEKRLFILQVTLVKGSSQACSGTCSALRRGDKSSRGLLNLWHADMKGLYNTVINTWLPTSNVQCIDNSVLFKFAKVTEFRLPNGVKQAIKSLYKKWWYFVLTQGCAVFIWKVGSSHVWSWEQQSGKSWTSVTVFS